MPPRADLYLYLTAPEPASSHTARKPVGDARGVAVVGLFTLTMKPIFGLPCEAMAMSPNE